MLILPHLYKPKARKNVVCFEKRKLADEKRVFQVNMRIYILSLKWAIKFNVLFVNMSRNATCISITKQCTVRNMMLMQEKLETIKLNLNRHYANKEVSLPICTVSQAKIQ